MKYAEIRLFLAGLEAEIYIYCIQLAFSRSLKFLEKIMCHFERFDCIAHSASRVCHVLECDEVGAA